MTVEIPLANGLAALVDEEDAALVAPYGWVALKSQGRGCTLWYARSRIAPGSERRHLMHTFLTGWALVDHINGDGLDNRRANLRAATRGENMANRRKHRATTSRFKGVSWWQPKTGRPRWIAHCARQHLGLFDDEVNAAIAYDMAARAKWGEYAALNFPGPGERGALAA